MCCNLLIARSEQGCIFSNRELHKRLSGCWLPAPLAVRDSWVCLESNSSWAGVLSVARHDLSIRLLDKIETNVHSFVIVALFHQQWRQPFKSCDVFNYFLPCLVAVPSYVCLPHANHCCLSSLFLFHLSSEVLLLKVQLDLSHEKSTTIRSPLQKLFECVLQKS